MSDRDPQDTNEIDRRRLLHMLATGAVAVGSAGIAGATQSGGHEGHGAHKMSARPGQGAAGMMDHPMPASTPLPGPRPQIAMLIYPGMIMLDLAGPQTVFNLGQCDVHLVAKTRDPCRTELGIAVTPTTDFAGCPRNVDVLCMPGGLMGSIACMNDPETMAFIADIGARARYVTSVCTGGLMLAAAGMLRGYRATAHWGVVDLLPIMGAKPSRERVVVDRNRITGGGVTAGIDFGLTLLAKLRGEEVAHRAQLTIEYAPEPPFNAGTVEGAGPELVGKMRKSRVWMDASARKAAEGAAARLSIKA